MEVATIAVLYSVFAIPARIASSECLLGGRRKLWLAILVAIGAVQVGVVAAFGWSGFWALCAAAAVDSVINWLWLRHRGATITPA
ncbi:MAG: hypothetical protein LBU11_12400 [Zoogloeaceae bacterium]|jgi:hypothetical protein|nr:hypothetical protein [Zoogloeaceae bacterium]